jgi:hypothetical protein
MTEHKFDRARVLSPNDVTRLRKVISYIEEMTGHCQSTDRQFPVAASHFSCATLPSYLRRLNYTTVTSQANESDERWTFSRMRQRYALERYIHFCLSEGLNAGSSDDGLSPMADYPVTTMGASDETAGALSRLWDDLDRSSALQAHLTALDGQLRASD